MGGIIFHERFWSKYGSVEKRRTHLPDNRVESLWRLRAVRLVTSLYLDFWVLTINLTKGITCLSLLNWKPKFKVWSLQDGDDRQQGEEGQQVEDGCISPTDPHRPRPPTDHEHLLKLPRVGLGPGEGEPATALSLPGDLSTPPRLVALEDEAGHLPVQLAVANLGGPRLIPARKDQGRGGS